MVGDPVPATVGEVVVAHLVATEVVGDVEVTDGDVKVFLFLFRISRTGSFGSQSVTASDQHKTHRHVGVCSTQPNQTPVGRAPHP